MTAEKQKGWKMKACRRSVRRIVNNLYSEGLLEYLNVQLADKSIEVSHLFEQSTGNFSPGK